MSHQKLLQQVTEVILVMLFLVGCGGPAATPVSEAPAATSAPGQAAATPTPEPPTPTPTPVPVYASGWGAVTVHTLCLQVEQFYPQIKDPSFSQPIEETVQSILTDLGLHVVAEGTSCEATLTLTIIGKALGASYMTAGTCYTGAEIDGAVVLTIQGREPLSQTISAMRPTSEFVQESSASCSGAHYAPFGSVWPEAVLDGLAYLWGPPVLVQAVWNDRVGYDAADALQDVGPEAAYAVPTLIQALSDEDGHVRKVAATALGQIGPEAVDAVPALIQALGDKDVIVRHMAAAALGQIGPEAVDAVPALIQALGHWDLAVRTDSYLALRKITGQDFDKDAARWQDWWEDQQ
jgi:hypothetical protein